MLVFCDESWKETTDGKKVGTLAAVAIPRADYNSIEDRVFLLAQKYFGFKNAREKEIKGKRLLTSYEYNREAKGHVSLKLAFARELMEEMRARKLAAFASVVFSEREVELLCEESDRLDRPYSFLLERAQGHVSEVGSDCRGALVFDDRGLLLNKRVAEAYRNFLTRSRVGRSFEGLLRSPFFAYSHCCTGLQLADLLCTVVNRYHTERDASPHIRTLYSLARDMEWRAKEPNAEGYLLAGFKCL